MCVCESACEHVNLSVMSLSCSMLLCSSAVSGVCVCVCREVSQVKPDTIFNSYLL